MTTEILIENNLLQEASKFSNFKSTNELIKTALTEFVENQKRKKLLELKGRIIFYDDYDYKKMRETH